MKELFESIWYAPKGDVVNVLNQIVVAWAIGLVVGISIAIILIWWIMRK